MVGNCSLATDINKCPYFVREKEGCNKDSKICCFFSGIEFKKEITETREVKWFEKYYK